MIWENICSCLLHFCSHLFFYICFSKSIFKILDNFLLSFTYKVTTETCNFVSFIVKIIFSELTSSLSSVPATVKTQCFFHLSFSSTLQVINFIYGNLQKLLRYFNGTAIDTFSRISFASFGLACVIVFPNNIAS